MFGISEVSRMSTAALFGRVDEVGSVLITSRFGKKWVITETSNQTDCIKRKEFKINPSKQLNKLELNGVVNVGIHAPKTVNRWHEIDFHKVYEIKRIK